jgi:hypothetical protein
VLERAVWPNGQDAKIIPVINGRVREVSTTGRGYAGEFESAKLNRKVQHESHMELRFLKKLEQDDNVEWYQEQPLHLPYQHKGRTYQYYPDVLVRLSDSRFVVVKIVDVYELATSINLAKFNALQQFCAKRGWGMLVTDGRHSLTEIQERGALPAYETAVLRRLQNGKLDYPSYKQIQVVHRTTYIDLCALILRENLSLTCRPWRLSLG